MYNVSYDYGDYATTTAVTTVGGLGAGVVIFYLILIAFILFCTIKVFMKAGRKWWEAIIPIYSNYVLTQMAGLEILYFVLCFIPFANIYAMFKIYIELAKKFGKSTGFGVCMVFFNPICMAILALDKSTYNGGTVEPTNPNNLNQQPIYAGQAPVNTADQTMINGVVTPTAPAVEPTQPTVAPTPMTEPTMNQEPVAPEVEQPQVAESPVASVVESTPVAEPTMNQEPVTPEVEQPQVAPVASANKFCPQCGTQVAIDATFCPSCGASIQ